MLERFDVYVDGRIVHKGEGIKEYPYPFNYIVDWTMKWLETQPYGTVAMILDANTHVLIGTIKDSFYNPCPWTADGDRYHG